MAITFSCTCGKRLQVADNLAGKLVLCPGCKAKTRVAQPDAIVAEAPPVLLPAPGKKPPPPPVPVEAADDPPPPQDAIVAEPPPFVSSASKKRPPPPDDEDEDDEDEIDDDLEEPDNEVHCPATGEAAFLRKAPKQIGPLYSSHTSLVEGVEPRSLGMKLGCVALVTVPLLFFLMIGAVVMQLVAANPMPWIALILAYLGFSAVLLIAVLALVFHFTQFEHYCGYIGRKGVAYFACSGRPSKLVKDEMMLFAEAADLRIQTTHHLTNGAYTHTDFSYVWNDKDDETLLTIAGTHHAYNDAAPPEHLYNFAQEAERFWAIYLLGEILPKLKKGGKHKFRLSGANYILMRKDSLQLNLGGDKQEFYADEIAEMRIENGTIILKEPGASKGWFTESGFHRFDFAELSNARVFLLLIHEMYGVPIN